MPTFPRTISKRHCGTRSSPKKIYTKFALKEVRNIPILANGYYLTTLAPGEQKIKLIQKEVT
jgi:hypothetical protein